MLRGQKGLGVLRVWRRAKTDGDDEARGRRAPKEASRVSLPTTQSSTLRNASTNSPILDNIRFRRAFLPART